MHHLSLADVFKYLKVHLPDDWKVPSTRSIGYMLKKHFHLRFKSQSPAIVKYIDPTYNERRLWASRLLA